MAPLIAIVGSDGSGKSTVGEALLAWLRERGPVELCHLGKQSGNLGRVIAGLPLLGGRLGRTIDEKVRQAGGSRGPRTLEALVIYAFTMRRLRRFRRMQRLRRSGVTILADRFPQLAIPSAIDGPGFGKVRSDQGIAKRLAARERRHFEGMTREQPDLVIRLNVDVLTAVRRKPDHRPEALASKIADLHRLRFGDAPIVDIDATLPLADVLDQARRAIEPVLSHRAAAPAT